ncbi:MAG: response regulator transcription factor [Deltaproteobacteria bacterium]|nr:response regulator transcription factor [Deltaproteobacteria bacterium]
MKIKVLIADDQRLFRQGLRSLLEQEEDMAVVAEASDGQDAFTAAQETSPDIILMDVEMPKLDGIRAVRMILERNPLIKVLMLSVHNENERVISAIEAGAVGYILKDADHREFVKIIRSAYAGKKIASPFLASIPAASRIRTEEEFEKEFKDASMTEREAEVFKLLLKGKSNKDISAITHISTDTVKTHLQNIYRKLGVRSRLEAVARFLKEEE